VIGTFDYVRALSRDDVGRALREAAGDVAILAGGTDLLVELRNGVRSLDLLIDIKRIDDLGAIDIDESEITIGAAVPLNRVIEHAEVRRRLAGVADAAATIATYQLRNRATLVGNLCNASPAADMAPVLLALGAEVRVAGPDGERSVRLTDLFTGVKRTCLEAGEWVTAIRIPTPPDVRTAFLKQQRIRGHDLAVVNVGGAFVPETRALTLAVGSCAPTPLPFGPFDARDAAGRAVETIEAAVAPIDDVRASAAYRRAVLPVLVRRTIDRLVAPKGGP